MLTLKPPPEDWMPPKCCPFGMGDKSLGQMFVYLLQQLAEARSGGQSQQPDGSTASILGQSGLINSRQT